MAVVLCVCFGIVSVYLLESAVHDMRIIEKRQDRLETKLYFLDKHFREEADDGPKAEKDQAV